MFAVGGGGGGCDVRVREVSARGRRVAAFPVPEQPHTDKPFLRPPEMMPVRVGDGEEEGGGQGEGVGRRVIYQQQQQTCRQNGSYCS